jgi:hypothetical protein
MMKVRAEDEKKYQKTKEAASVVQLVFRRPQSTLPLWQRTQVQEVLRAVIPPLRFRASSI